MQRLPPLKDLLRLVLNPPDLMVSSANPSSPYIIPFFISHAGCPHQCVFCNQHDISGASRPVTPEQIRLEIEICLKRSRDMARLVQVAFYGGSFTGLAPAYQRQLLAAVAPFIERGDVAEIRLSTRPDCLDESRISLLLEYGVSLVELGVQSLDAEVLLASGRGHSAQQVEDAFILLQEAGLKVGGQLMVGLPLDTPRRSVRSCRKLMQYKPDCVRIYPTLVMTGTPLAQLYRAGSFQPWSLDKTVVVVARLKQLFDGASIPVVRMGLQAGESLEQSCIAGPYHPAFGELVLSRLLLGKIRRNIFKASPNRDRELKLTLSSRDRSLFMGMKKENFQRLHDGRWLEKTWVCFSDSQPRFEVLVSYV